MKHKVYLRVSFNAFSISIAEYEPHKKRIYSIAQLHTPYITFVSGNVWKTTEAAIENPTPCTRTITS